MSRRRKYTEPYWEFVIKVVLFPFFLIGLLFTLLDCIGKKR